MGKGDQKSTRGKRVRGSYGKTRPRKASKSVLVVEKAVKAKQNQSQNQRNQKLKKRKNLLKNKKSRLVKNETAFIFLLGIYFPKMLPSNPPSPPC